MYTESKKSIIKNPFLGKKLQFENPNDILHKEEDMKIHVFLSLNFPGGIQD